LADVRVGRTANRVQWSRPLVTSSVFLKPIAADMPPNQIGM